MKVILSDPDEMLLSSDYILYNLLDPDEACHNVGPGLVPKCLTL